MSAYKYPLSSALSEYFQVQPDPAQIVKAELMVYTKLTPQEQVKIIPLLKAGVPGAQAKALAQGDEIKYRTVIAMLGQSVPLATISANLDTIAAYDEPRREAILVCLEKGLSFADAKTLVDRLR